MTNNIVKFLTAGSVDDGKSTLIGRLLHDTGSLYLDQIAEVKKLSGEGNKLDYSLFIEGLESERRQKITIDVAYRYFSYANTKFIIADSPGHEEYTKNMAVAAANSDVAVILIDAREGIKPQTVRHSYIAHLFGIKHFVVAINKIDLVDYSQKHFDDIKEQYLEKTKIFDLSNISFVPVSAINGDNIVKSSPNMPWYKGKSFVETLASIKVVDQDLSKPFRFSVQNVLTSPTNQRFYQGKVWQGRVNVGDEIYAFPAKQSAKIIEIIHSSKNVESALFDESISIVLDRDIDIDRGSVFIQNSANKQNIFFSQNLNADLIWFDKKQFDLHNQEKFLIKLNHNIVDAKISAVRHVINMEDFSKYESHFISQNHIVTVDIELSKNITFDKFKDNKFCGSFLLIQRDTNETVACGLINQGTTALSNLQSTQNKSPFIDELAELIKKHFGADGSKRFINQLNNNNYDANI